MDRRIGYLQTCHQPFEITSIRGSMLGGPASLQMHPKTIQGRLKPISFPTSIMDSLGQAYLAMIGSVLQAHHPLMAHQAKFSTLAQARTDFQILVVQALVASL